MKTIISLLLSCLSLSGLFSQTEKGVSPLPTQNPKLETRNSTRAVVVGISDYQSPAIPDLQFADRDAREFAGWLKSAAGGAVPEDNITLLTNEKATVAAVGTALYSMLDACKTGERLVIYFSGHGDVEAKTKSQPGYLLCHDSPANVYMVGALNLRDLQEIVSTLSENGVQVVIITDACHAGKLAGAGIGGTQATASAMSKQFAGEVKIMSCQPSEFSLEGKQWGGGRGVFSYNLLEGLTGLADKNGDGTVNLMEITRYLQDMVPAATAPHPQLPMSVGDLMAALNSVDLASLAALKTSKATPADGIFATGSKGLEEEILAKTDERTRQLYADFKNAVAGHAFFEKKGAAAGADAESLFAQLNALPALEHLRGLMARNYAVALLDEVQQAINALLDNDPYEANRWRFSPAGYAQYPAYLDRAMGLLGEKHYLRRSLEAKKLYFEGYNLFKNVGEFQNEPARRDSFKMAARGKFLASLALQPDAAYVYFAIGQTFSLYQNQTYHSDSVYYWCQKAIDLAPGWGLPYMDIIEEAFNSQFDFPKADEWIKRAMAVAPDNYFLLEKLSWIKQSQFQPEEANRICDRMIELKPNLFNAYSTKAQTLALIQADFLEAEKYALKSLELEPNQMGWAGQLLGYAYFRTRRTEQAIAFLKKGLDSPAAATGVLVPLILALTQKGDCAAAERYCQLGDAHYNNHAPTVAYRKTAEGRLYFLQNRMADAEKTLKAALAADPTYNSAWVLDWEMLGEIEAGRGNMAEAERLFNQLDSVQMVNGNMLWFAEALFRRGRYLLSQNRTADAEARFQKIGQILPKSWNYSYGMALISAKKKDKKAALDWLEKALDNFYPEPKSILAEPLFSKIKKTKRFKAMMLKNFPPGWEEW